MVFKKECNNAKHARLLGIIKKIEDRYFSIELIKDVENRYLNYHMKLIINPGTPITVDYKSSKYYFKDHQSYDHAQKLLDKVKNQSQKKIILQMYQDYLLLTATMILK